MNPLGTTLQMMIGPTIALPAPPQLMDVFERAEVTHSDDSPSAFQLTFRVGRSGPLSMVDFGLMSMPILRPFHRLILVVMLGGIPQVLFDGVITHIELEPSATPGESKLRVTGEDLTTMMDMEDKSVEHPAQDETIIATKIIATYAQYGLIPMVIPPLMIDPPIPIERIPVQQGSDFAYLVEMAKRHGYVFYIVPGPAPMMSRAYWGPPMLLDVPQQALTVGMGAHSNAEVSSIRADAEAPEVVKDEIQDRITNETMPVQTFAPLRPPLALLPSWLTQGQNVRKTRLRTSGLNTMQAFARAQATTNAASDSVTVTGNLDSTGYGGILRARGIVGLRGVGFSHDGFFYVKSVTHNIAPGSYTQSFTLTREGVGSTTPVVIP